MASQEGESVAELLTDARQGQRRAIGRLLSWAENSAGIHTALDPQPLGAALAPYTARAQIVGVTGAPGVGKSTCTSGLIAEYRGQGRRVGVLAVDPSSPFSGGALLGDRVRMSEHALDDEVIIRSMSSRGTLGGLAAATPRAVRVLEALGCEVILVETVGVGQAEVEIAALADTTVVLLAPGMGDSVQATKAGIIEIADVFVVNKADRDGAQTVVRDLKNMLALGGRHSAASSWRPRIVSTVASRAEGIGDVVDAIAEHRVWLDKHGQRQQHRLSQAVAEITAITLDRVRAFLADTNKLAEPDQIEQLAEAVVAGHLDAYTASVRLLPLAHPSSSR